MRLCLEVSRLTCSQDTILTAFPQQWSGGSAFGTIPDETDVFGGIWKELQKKHFLDQVTDVKTLAYLIIDRCACNVYDPESIKNPDMQFLRQFDESIDNLVSRTQHTTRISPREDADSDRWLIKRSR